MESNVMTADQAAVIAQTAPVFLLVLIADHQKFLSRDRYVLPDLCWRS